MASATPAVAADKADNADKQERPEKPAPATDNEKEPNYNVIVLQGLNKVTGHISKIEAPLGTVMRFGNLEIIARRCWKAAPEDRPENAGLLEIRELKTGEEPAQIFLGWMFSSSPGLSGLEHPVYDITVLACESHDDSEKEKPAEKSEKPDKNKAAKTKPKLKAKPATKPVEPVPVEPIPEEDPNQ